jgi:putative spermidine/putrescine transport system substrate-binding protein
MSQKDLEQCLTARRISRREVLKLGAAAGAAAFLAACGSKGAPTPSASELLASSSIPLDILIAMAKKEGALTTIALPHDWANYGEIIDAYKKRYGLSINELNPNGGSADEIDAITKNKGSTGPEAPDVVDVGLGFTESSRNDGLFAPYKVATWDTIPNVLKDPDGYWYGDYYGVLAFEANSSLVKELPKDWPDLLKPDYKGMVALAGDPTKSSQAIHSVWAAGLSVTGSLDDAPMAGLDFFAALNKAGNFVPVIGSADTLAKGQTSVLVEWDYLALGNRDALKGNPEIAVVVPKTGVLGGAYAQAVSAYAPHPFAARLWMEFLYSDDGQLLWLKGYAHPIRYNDLVKNDLVPPDLAAKLPPAELYARTAFPTLDQITEANKVISENWMARVGVEVKAPQ